MRQLPTIIVPARLASSRLEHKLLYPIEGKPLILWTAERIRSEAPEFPLFFAVDSEELYECLTLAGFEAIKTRQSHPSGTDRIAEANEVIGADRVINVQGDEPLISGEHIKQLADALSDGHSMATLATRFTNTEEFYDSNCVKVVQSLDGQALYFSRAPIPYARESKGSITIEWLSENRCFKHLGIYAYTAEFLQAIPNLRPGVLESIERLEQLRVLENGYFIQLALTDKSSLGIDTIEDIERFKVHLAS